MGAHLFDGEADTAAFKSRQIFVKYLSVCVASRTCDISTTVALAVVAAIRIKKVRRDQSELAIISTQLILLTLRTYLGVTVTCALTELGRLLSSPEYSAVIL